MGINQNVADASVPRLRDDKTLLQQQVVGAGRGPLVRASLAAAAETGRAVRIYAVEKNPNAVVTLQSLVASEGCASSTAPECLATYP